jgi:hypothetical protein
MLNASSETTINHDVEVISDRNCIDKQHGIKCHRIINMTMKMEVNGIASQSHLLIFWF